MRDKVQKDDELRGLLFLWLVVGPASKNRVSANEA